MIDLFEPEIKRRRSDFRRSPLVSSYSTKYSDFGRYSTEVVILEIIPKKSDFRRYS